MLVVVEEVGENGNFSKIKFFSGIMKINMTAQKLDNKAK